MPYLYLLAIMGAVFVVLLFWRAFGPQKPIRSDRHTRTIAPDDDLEFLRKLDRESRNDRRNKPDESG